MTSVSDSWDRLAAVIADGLAVAEGTSLAVSLTGLEAYPLARALTVEALRRGALPQTVLSTDDFDRLALSTATPEVLATASPLELAAIHWADAYVSLRAMTVPEQARGEEGPPSPARQVTQRRAKGAVSTARWDHTRWCVVRVPTPAWASRAGLSPHDVEQEFIAGCTLDWDARRVRWQSLCDRLGSAQRVHISDEDTDLVMGVRGRTWVPFAGEANLPDGEIATAPTEAETEGYIRFPGRFWFADTMVEDLRLTFAEGRCVDVRATRGADFARAMVAADSGSDIVGELGIGVNHRMSLLTGDLFLDEKVLGTVHLALGRAYPQCGGTNRSDIHWDIVKDLRGPHGRLTVDDTVLIEDGCPRPPLVDRSPAPPDPSQEQS